MNQLRNCSYGAVLVAFLCWSSLLVGAEDLMTHPAEGDFDLVATERFVSRYGNLSFVICIFKECF